MGRHRRRRAWPSLGPEHIIQATTTRQEDTGEAISRFDVAGFAPPGRFYDLARCTSSPSRPWTRLRELVARQRLRRPPLPAQRRPRRHRAGVRRERLAGPRDDARRRRPGRVQLPDHALRHDDHGAGRTSPRTATPCARSRRTTGSRSSSPRSREVGLRRGVRRRQRGRRGRRRRRARLTERARPPRPRRRTPGGPPLEHGRRGADAQRAPQPRPGRPALRRPHVDLPRARRRRQPGRRVLGELGVGKGDRVATYGRNSDAYLLAFLGCARPGAVHVPINYALTGEELGYLRRAVRQPAAAGRPGAGRPTSTRCASTPKQVVPLRDADGLAARPVPHRATCPTLDSTVADSDLVQLLYTSGTTSRPKGAMMTHRALVHEYVSCVQAMAMHRRRTTPLHPMPLYHSAGMHCFLLPYLAVGAVNHLMEAPDIPEVLRRIEADRLGAVFLAPTVWVPLANHADFGDPRPVEPAQGVLRRVDHARDRCWHGCASACPACGVYNCFGQSEIGPLATVLQPEEHDERPESCGRAGAVRRAAGDRRRRQRRRAGRHRRGGLPLAAALRGLLGQARRDRRGVPRRLVPLGRPRAHRRRGLHHRRRPDQGRDQHRRGARRVARGRGRALHPPGRRRGGGDRHPRREVDRGGDGLRGAQEATADRSARARSRHARARLAGFKVPEGRVRGRRAAPQPVGEAAQARPARPVPT